jgi:hypothetical protein
MREFFYWIFIFRLKAFKKLIQIELKVISKLKIVTIPKQLLGKAFKRIK